MINTTRFIVEMVCAGEGVLSEQLFEQSTNNKLGRKREVVFARQVIMYLRKKTSRDSLVKIASDFFDQDHANASHAIKTVRNLVDSDKIIAKRIDYYIEQINSISLVQKNIIIKKLSESQDIIRQKLDTKEEISLDIIVVYNTLLEKEQSLNEQINKNLSK